MGGIEVHGNFPLAFVVELCSIVVDAEMVTFVALPILSRRRNVDQMAILAAVGHERLWADETMREIRMYQHGVGDGEKVSIIVKSFPRGDADIFDGQTTGDTAEKKGCSEPANALGVHVRETVGG